MRVTSTLSEKDARMIRLVLDSLDQNFKNVDQNFKRFDQKIQQLESSMRLNCMCFALRERLRSEVISFDEQIRVLTHRIERLEQLRSAS